ncbi:MAG: hypothetical protein IK099_14740 [Clostridia bacterium]|nr:hypothetical protein [Clostridia bacterium]
MVKDRNKLSSPQRILFRFDLEGNLLSQTEIVFDQMNETYGCWPVPTESGLWFLTDDRTEDDDFQGNGHRGYVAGESACDVIKKQNNFRKASQEMKINFPSAFVL